MAIVRWAPFGDMTDMTRALNRYFSESALGHDEGSQSSTRQIAINLRETDKAFEVETMLPGVDPADVQIHITHDMLTIKGEMKQETARETGEYLCRECHEGSFYRQISLPAHVLGDEASASAHNGILTITIPKAPVAPPRKIEVRTNGAAPKAVEAKPVKAVAAKPLHAVSAKATTKSAVKAVKKVVKK